MSRDLLANSVQHHAVDSSNVDAELRGLLGLPAPFNPTTNPADFMIVAERMAVMLKWRNSRDVELWSCRAHNAPRFVEGETLAISACKALIDHLRTDISDLF